MIAPKIVAKVLLISKWVPIDDDGNDDKDDSGDNDYHYIPNKGCNNNVISILILDISISISISIISISIIINGTFSLHRDLMMWYRIWCRIGQQSFMITSSLSASPRILVKMMTMMMWWWSYLLYDSWFHPNLIKCPQ